MADHKNLSEVKLFCQKQLNQFVQKNWCNNIEDFQLSKLSGGLTNTLYLCGRAHSDADDNKYVVRFFGKGKVNNINEENIIASVVGAMKLGPGVLGIFEGGRIEEFIPSHTITTPELAGVTKTVANMTARLHKLSMPIDKSGDYLKVTLDIYMEKIRSKYGESMEKLEPDFRRKVTDAYEMTLTILSNTNSPVCFCHNDTQPGNTLKPLNTSAKSSEPLFFIDYEYSAYNNRAFDAGNFFAEWIYNYEHTKEAGGYSAKLENYPSIESQKEYAVAYFEEMNGSDTVDEEEVLKFIEEARQFTLVSHCFWAIWCLVNDESEEFDYMHYANCRLDHFFKQNDIFNGLKEE